MSSTAAYGTAAAVVGGLWLLDRGAGEPGLPPGDPERETAAYHSTVGDPTFRGWFPGAFSLSQAYRMEIASGVSRRGELDAANGLAGGATPAWTLRDCVDVLSRWERVGYQLAAFLVRDQFVGDLAGGAQRSARVTDAADQLGLLAAMAAGLSVGGDYLNREVTRNTRRRLYQALLTFEAEGAGSPGYRQDDTYLDIAGEKAKDVVIGGAGALGRLLAGATWAAAKGAVVATLGNPVGAAIALGGAYWLARRTGVL